MSSSLHGVTLFNAHVTKHRTACYDVTNDRFETSAVALFTDDVLT